MRICSRGRCELGLQKQLPLPSFLIGRCLSGQMEISRRTGSVRRHESKSLQKGITTLLEASLCHLLVTPPSHFIPQKAKGQFFELTGLWQETTNGILDQIGMLSREISPLFLFYNNHRLSWMKASCKRFIMISVYLVKQEIPAIVFMFMGTYIRKEITTPITYYQSKPAQNGGFGQPSTTRRSSQFLGQTRGVCRIYPVHLRMRDRCEFSRVKITY